MTDNDKIDKKAKGTKKCEIKEMIKSDDYKKCLLNDKVILKSQQRFISNKHDVYTEDVNKIALSNDYDKRIVSPDKISSYTDIRFKELRSKELGSAVGYVV